MRAGARRLLLRPTLAEYSSAPDADCHPRESGDPVITDLCVTLRRRCVLGRAVKPGDDGGYAAPRPQVRKKTNQTTARIRIARPREMASSAATDGPGSACRASVGVSTICPR